MYLKIIGAKRDILYIDIPQNPCISVFQDEEDGEWIAALSSHSGDGLGIVLKTGTYSECHEVVNKILDAVGSTPVSL